MSNKEILQGRLINVNQCHLHWKFWEIFCKNGISGDQKDLLLKERYPSETQYLSYSVSDLWQYLIDSRETFILVGVPDSRFTTN